MNNLIPIFTGNVRLHLEGSDPLLQSKPEKDDASRYYIGSEKTNLVIFDYRTEPAVISQPSSGYMGLNPLTDEVFLRPSWAEVFYQETDDSMEIILSNSDADGELPILWLGILEENMMPAYEVEWEVFKRLTPQRVAFAALIP